MRIQNFTYTDAGLDMRISTSSQKTRMKKKGEEDSLRETLQMQVSKNAIRSVPWLYEFTDFSTYMNFKIPQNREKS